MAEEEGVALIHKIQRRNGEQLTKVRQGVDRWFIPTKIKMREITLL